MSEPFGFDHPASRPRRTTGRRLLSDRRVVPDRRLQERRIEIGPITVDRRGVVPRRIGFERRRNMDRRIVDDRRFAAWRDLEGN